MGRPALWNVDLGRRLYDEGHSYGYIAERCGATAPAVANIAQRHWQTSPRPACVAQWDTALGRTLWDEGLTYNAIAKRCDTTRHAVIGYAKRHWQASPGDAERYAKLDPSAPRVVRTARPLKPGQRTLPDLPSLVGYY